MPPTLTTKSSDTVSAPRFSIVTKALAGEGAPDTDAPRFRAIASSTIVDRDGDEISLKALQQMAQKFRDGVTIFTDHENKVANAYGTTDTAEILQAGTDKAGNAVWDLAISGPVNAPSPNAMQLHRSISGGYVKLGCSIDAYVLDHTRKKSGGLSIDGLDVFAASIVGVPANQRSWTQKAVRAIKSFHPDEEDEDVLTKELAGEPDATDNAPAELEAPAVADIAVEIVGEDTETPVEAEAPAAEALVACPECGQSAETTGCDNGFHSVEQSADESTSGVQASAQETPETTPTEDVETDTANEQKAASISADDVHALVSHVERLVKEISHLREENKALATKNEELERTNQTVYGEVELAKQVIGKVMEQPLRAKTAGFVNEFKDAHSLFDPEIAAYLTKRGEIE